MIDIHLHLLPKVDDGSSSIEISTTMIQGAARLGYTRLVSTPHLDGPLTATYRSAIDAAFASISPLARQAGIELELGFEIQLGPDLPYRLEKGEPLTLARSNTVLVEVPFQAWPLHADQTLFGLQTAGFRALLAHPERYSAIQADHEKALELADRGVLLQVTVGSLVGLFGKPSQRVAEELLRAGAATVLATDAHSAGQRFTSIEAGLKRAKELVGADRVRQLTTDNPLALLTNAPLPDPARVETVEAGGGWRESIRRGLGRGKS